ncbi:MAG: signal peptide peptidase SppA, partial [Planctomycetaceae bacterium]|nr:signal peptide peptidase SppA [Planctomycetaceae bacterium]
MSMPVHNNRWFLVALLLGCALLLTPHAASAADKDKAAEKEEKPVRENWAHMVIKGSYPEGPQMPGLFG